MSCAFSEVQLLNTDCEEAASSLQAAPSALVEERRGDSGGVEKEDGGEMTEAVCELRE